MHPVLGDIVHTQGLERAGADVQRDVGEFRASRTACLQQCVVEVQPGRRRRDRAWFTRVHRLVTIAVRGLGCACHVRRQGYFTDPIEDRMRIAAEFDAPEIVFPVHDREAVAGA
jgi:hypothetical protein